MSEDTEADEHSRSSTEESAENDEDDENDWRLPLAYDRPRHAELIEGVKSADHSWRLKEKYKTHCVALILCLNVGVDPPDMVKTQPCARLECWIDPSSYSPTKALESIGQALQQQYERWQPRARYKQSLDPTSEDVKKLCCSLRKNAKDERVLFHYNGHGVPKPTQQGEIWVFNKAYTQYIPLSVYDLQAWMGAPSLYVYDCSNAGVILEQFKQFAEQHEKDQLTALQQSKAAEEPPLVSYKNCIQLGACGAGETLPMNPEMPADLFTSCLTTPVKMAVRWFVLRCKTRVTPANVADLIDKIPGQLTDRRTMLGELNWIFTAITDTIAWSSLPPHLFQQLFRADLLTASLCRNFLLADRIMRSYNCTPVSSPALPSLAGHPMWQAWDQTLDLALAQLPDMLGKQGAEYKHSPFFREQLTAFQVWLDLGSPRRPPPDQLPMVLQVLLSTVHRVRALQILCRFLALGAWAVRAVLAVGIFPYMLKLLQASSHDLRAPMVYIWAKIVAVDPSCQADLVNAKGHRYFLSVLQDTSVESEHRTLAAYVLAGIVDNFYPGQEAALQGQLISICLEQLNDPNPLLRQWLAICLGRLWRDYDAARWSGVRDLAHEKLYTLLEEPHPEVRAAATFALGTFIQCSRERSEHANTIDQQVAATIAKRAPHEASHLVRAEILAALQWMVLAFENNFVAASLQDETKRGSSRERQRSERGTYTVEAGQDALFAASRSTEHIIRKVPSSSCIPTMAASLQNLNTIGFVSVYTKLWALLCAMCNDPYPQVADMGKEIVNFIKNQQLDVSVGRDFVEVVRSYSGSSSSLPPSPNTRGQHMNLAASNTLPAAGSKKVKSSHMREISEDSSSHRDHHNSISSSQSKKRIVSTEYVQWASSQFARCAIDEDWQKDQESRLYQERKWRYNRNRSLRKEAKELVAAGMSRIESQVFYARAPLPPAVVMFHPYDQHIAVASKDNFGIWNWGTGAKLCASVWRGACGAARVTGLQYINAHDQSLLAIATAAGDVAIFKSDLASLNGRSREPQLVTAWSALDVVATPSERERAEWRTPPTAAPLYMGSLSGGVVPALRTDSTKRSYESLPWSPPAAGAHLAWSARDSTLAVGGDSRHVRLWDAATELRTLDIGTDCKAAVTSLTRCGWELIAGFGDGSVRVWDTRRPKRVALAHHDHQAALLCACRHLHSAALVTGCTSGEVRIYDARRPDAMEVLQAGPTTAMAVHPLHNMLACGSATQSINMYNLQGATLGNIRFHEGFMGARIGLVSCLAFHPLRCALAVGTRDSTVSVYSSDARR